MSVLLRKTEKQEYFGNGGFIANHKTNFQKLHVASNIVT